MKSMCMEGPEQGSSGRQGWGLGVMVSDCLWGWGWFSGDENVLNLDSGDVLNIIALYTLNG